MDTNVVIAAEPTAYESIEPGTRATISLIGRIQADGHVVQVHPAARTDLARSNDASRHRLRSLQVSRYPVLQNPPPIPASWVNELGVLEPGGNDHVDALHLAAVDADAVSYLLTEDRRLHRLAARLGLGSRVVTVEDAETLLRNLYVETPTPPPVVDRILAHQLDADDPIFESIREDYPGFDLWLSKAKREQRTSFTIQGEGGSLAAVSLLKAEHGSNEAHLPGDVLKISTFKVSPDHAGHRYGELLLKAVFLEAAAGDFDGMYLTVHADRHPALVGMLLEFGFEALGSKRPTEELILGKRRPTPRGVAADSSDMDSWSFHVRYGPPALDLTTCALHVIPIQPRYTSRLFPEGERQQSLFAPAGYGNAIKKAYLSRAATRKIQPGDALLFYRSGGGTRTDVRGITVVGVAETTLASSEPGRIAAEVGTRTVYTMTEIEGMTAAGAVLAILFRQDRVLAQPIGIEELMGHGALVAAPQSITEVREEGREWIRTRIQQSR